jgi:hypothetical protein
MRCENNSPFPLSIKIVIISPGSFEGGRPLLFGDRKMLIPKKIVTFFCLIVILASVTNPLWGFSQVPPEPAAVPGKVLVKFEDGVTGEQSLRIIEKEGGTVKGVSASTGVHIIILPDGVDVNSAIERFSSYPEVRYVEPVQRALPLEEN